MKLTYDSIGKTIQMTMPLNALSSRDKIELFRELMDQLGITERFHQEPNATARAQEIIVEQWNTNWGGPK